MQHAPPRLGRVAALLAGMALPLAIDRIIEAGQVLLAGTLIGVLSGAVLLASLHGRAEGWKISIVVLTLFALYSAIR